jgi:tetratricopeptide (TPR) repeat protein
MPEENLGKEPQNEQSILKGANVDGDLTTGDISQTVNNQSSGVGGVNVGGNVSGSVIVTGSGNNIITSFWSRKSATLLASFAFLFIAIYLYIWNLKNPWQMPEGTFNVAITDFLSVNKKGEIQRLEEGKVLNQWITNSLNKEKDDPKNLDTASWKISKTNQYFIAADSSTELTKKIESFSKSINTNILIYGYLTETDNIDEKLLTIFFYVTSNNPKHSTGFVDTFNNNALKGAYQIGTPQLVNLKDRGGTEDFLSSRIKPLYWLLAGLTYSSTPQKALRIFQKAETYLSDEELKEKWVATSGKEVFYFCMGQVALFAANNSELNLELREKYLVESETAFQKALNVNPQYPKALIGRGSAYLVRASLDRDQLDKTPEQKRLTLQKKIDKESHNALIDYEKAIKVLPKDRVDIWSESGAILGIATYWLDKGNNDLDNQHSVEVELIQSKVVERIKPIIESLNNAEEYRLLSQAYTNLGAAYVLEAEIYRKKGDSNSVQKLIGMAIEAFNSCKIQATRAPDDEFIQKQIAGGCEEYINYARQI